MEKTNVSVAVISKTDEKCQTKNSACNRLEKENDKLYANILLSLSSTGQNQKRPISNETLKNVVNEDLSKPKRIKSDNEVPIQKPIYRTPVKENRPSFFSDSMTSPMSRSGMHANDSYAANLTPISSTRLMTALPFHYMNKETLETTEKLLQSGIISYNTGLMGQPQAIPVGYMRPNYQPALFNPYYNIYVDEQLKAVQSSSYDPLRPSYPYALRAPGDEYAVYSDGYSHPENTVENEMTVNKTGCNCKKSKCLKLYCLCFSRNIFCNPACRCVGCHNNPAYTKERDKVISSIVKKDPYAFKTALNSEGVSVTPRQTGCKCRRTECVKKYCECYSSGVPCTSLCMCQDCKNCAHSK
ncbi:hypothetical protein WA158_004637 [Blastocystis sp. Blastoise]